MEMMNGFYMSLAVLLLGTVALGLVRVWRGPTPADTMLAVLLMGTTGAGLLLLLALGGGMPGALDVALVFALLASVVGVAFVLKGWTGTDEQEEDR